jgi:hypothetical protein
VLCQVGFESLGKLTSREHNTPATAFAFEADIRTQACNGPLIGAAGMLFSEAEMIVQMEVG